MEEQDEFQKFVQSVVDNLRKNGFPDSKVAFPLERMYELADKKGLNFNKVLEALAGLGIAHEKTPEKVIFSSTAQQAPAAGNPFSGLDLSGLKDLPPDQMMAAAAQAMQQMNPEQLQALQGMLEGMTDEQREEMMEAAKKMGLF